MIELVAFGVIVAALSAFSFGKSRHRIAEAKRQHPATRSKDYGNG